MAFGVGLMWLADMDPEWQNTGFARLVDTKGAPLSVRKIGLRLRQDQRKCRRMLSELVDTCTLTYDADSDCYIFPNYRDHQESRDARYKRECRQSTGHSVDSSATVYDRGRGRGSEVDNTPQPPSGVVPPPAKKRKARKKPKGSYGVEPASVEDTEQVLAWIAKAREWCGFKASKLTATFANRCYVNVPLTILEASMDDWKRVINRQAVKDKDNPEAGRRYLTLSTLCRPDNFNRMLERDDLD